jgi:integrase
VAQLRQEALAVLREVGNLSQGELVFPSLYSNRKPLSDYTLNKALRKMDSSWNVMVAHGFRTSASTILNERRYGADVIEACLAHEDKSAVRPSTIGLDIARARKLLQEWPDLLDGFKQQAYDMKKGALDTSSIVPIKRAGTKGLSKALD